MRALGGTYEAIGHFRVDTTHRIVPAPPLHDREQALPLRAAWGACELPCGGLRLHGGSHPAMRFGLAGGWRARRGKTGGASQAGQRPGSCWPADLRSGGIAKQTLAGLCPTSAARKASTPRSVCHEPMYVGVLVAPRACNSWLCPGVYQAVPGTHPTYGSRIVAGTANLARIPSLMTFACCPTLRYPRRHESHRHRH